nr:MAG TPA: hypothetical protein [Caudoviricetes sp.]
MILLTFTKRDISFLHLGGIVIYVNLLIGS